ncbi:MAG: hypothetical protein HFF44_02075 [Lawsonibacter sp.]|nr:hypothetical protein [Lawsonibacter sp.]
MFDPKLYREACRELTAPEDKIEEIIAMTDKTNKKRIRPLRTALVCAAAVAMMVVSVAAANPEATQEFWLTLRNAVQVDQYRMDLTTEDGEKVSVISIPKARLENRDGRAVLMVDGKDVADITDALAREQHYVYEDVAEGSKISVTVDGTIDEWTMTADVGKLDEDGTYNWFGGVTTTNEDQDDSLGAQVFEDIAFSEVFGSVNVEENADPDAQVTVGIYYAGAEN